MVVADLCPVADLQGESRIAFGSDQACPTFYVPNVDKENCPSGGLGLPSIENGKLRAIDVRAVFYVPRPIGVSSGEKDLYTSAFKYLHRSTSSTSFRKAG